MVFPLSVVSVRLSYRDNFKVLRQKQRDLSQYIVLRQIFTIFGDKLISASLDPSLIRSIFLSLDENCAMITTDNLLIGI